jgi:hypothetical protein
MGLIDRFMQTLGLVPRIVPQSTEWLPVSRETVDFLDAAEITTGVHIFRDFYERTPFSVIEMYREFLGLDILPLPEEEEFVY